MIYSQNLKILTNCEIYKYQFSIENLVNILNL